MYGWLGLYVIFPLSFMSIVSYVSHLDSTKSSTNICIEIRVVRQPCGWVGEPILFPILSNVQCNVGWVCAMGGLGGLVEQ